MRCLPLALAALSTLCCAAAAERGPSTPEERKQAAEIAHRLEADPISPDNQANREWITMWLIEVPDIQVKVCSTLLDPLMGTKKNYASEIFGQMMFSSAAFAIENPEKANDDAAKYQAGLEGALKAYESILKTDRKARWKHLDDLIKRRTAGTLAEFVRESMKSCQ
jgi:carboxypeptidase Q